MEVGVDLFSRHAERMAAEALLFPGQSAARPAVDILFGVRLHQYGINAHAGRNTDRLALAAELPASVLADLTGDAYRVARHQRRRGNTAASE